MRRYILFPALVMLFSVLLYRSAEANDYSIPEIRIETVLLEDGTVRITEHLTYVFEGSFSWADHRFSRSGFDSITNIRVSEGPESYRNDNSEQPGTFSVSESDSRIIIKWHYAAEDTSRTFSISYDLKGALIVGEEWVEFFWNYLASGRNRSTENFTLEVSLPSPVSPDSMYVWDRLEPDHMTTKSPDGLITINTNRISRNQSARFRFLFPRVLFDDGNVRLNEPELTLANVIREEQERESRLRERAEYQEWINSVARPVTALIIVFSILFFVLLYNRYGKRFKTNFISERETVMLPDQTPPALVGKLLSNSITTQGHILATIFDLSRRGYFKIREKESEKKGIFSTSDSEFLIERTDKEQDPEKSRDLAEWEMMVYRFVDDRIRFGSVTIKKLFSESPTKVNKWFSDWKKEIRKVYDGHNWIDQESTKGVLLNIFLQAILVAASVYLLFYEADIALAALIVSGVMLPMSFLIKRRTEEGQAMYKRWIAYKKGLQNADKRTIRMDMLDRHFIYATAFGLSPKQIENLLQSADDSLISMYLPWIILYSGSTSSPASISQSISSLAATGGSSYTGSVGGTGASMGSAGGGASSGAG
ncbi:DUF2207 domain-containing protein [Rhodohalobacter mucosus]|uniref:DUF2207 domain-containing protein n=1 Tax=Rhodohalobacter mucosus TaxID=2079485 RepID=A0A316TWB0_9BACT|nr:DUF2207 domain-containing protein [Rhodohalobacter mucosus]PWN07495.1 hypothetical protein DDZ15_04330 [Rhodohalobacter mucosus]